jgi:hypothetical protein
MSFCKDDPMMRGANANTRCSGMQAELVAHQRVERPSKRQREQGERTSFHEIKYFFPGIGKDRAPSIEKTFWVTLSGNNPMSREWPEPYVWYEGWTVTLPKPFQIFAEWGEVIDLDGRVHNRGTR